MKYHSGEAISLGDRVAYKGQEGTIALIGTQSGTGSAHILREEWKMGESQVLIVFENGARLMLDNIGGEHLLVFRGRR